MTNSFVLDYDGGAFTREFGPGRGVSLFAQTLEKFNGVNPWGLALSALPSGVAYDDMLRAGSDFTAFLQAGGSADAMTLQIRKPATHSGGAVSVLYVVGHPHDGNPTPNKLIPLGTGVERVSEPEVFSAAEAAELFYTYYTTGDLPPQYTLRPILGWTADGAVIDYRQNA